MSIALTRQIISPASANVFGRRANPIQEHTNPTSQHPHPKKGTGQVTADRIEKTNPTSPIAFVLSPDVPSPTKGGGGGGGETGNKGGAGDGGEISSGSSTGIGGGSSIRGS